MTDLRTAAPPQRPADPAHRSRKMGQDDTPAKVRLSEGLGPNAEDDEREDIIRMAREAGLFEVPYPNPSNMKEVERFAALVTAAAPGFWGRVAARQAGRIKELEAALAQPEHEPPLQPEPVDFVSLLREADEILRGKPTWKRFIDGTPLSNDIAVWMTVFAQDIARRAAPPQRKPLTEEEIDAATAQARDALLDHIYEYGTAAEGILQRIRKLVRAVERAHGIKEEE